MNDNINTNFSVRISPDIPDPYAQMARGQKVSPHQRGRRETLFGADVHNFRRDVHDPKGLEKLFITKSLRTDHCLSVSGPSTKNKEQCILQIWLRYLPKARYLMLEK